MQGTYGGGIRLCTGNDHDNKGNSLPVDSHTVALSAAGSIVWETIDSTRKGGFCLVFLEGKDRFWVKRIIGFTGEIFVRQWL